MSAKTIAVVIFAVTAFQTLSRADAISDAGKQLSAKYRDSIVNISAVTKIEMTGLSSPGAQNTQERKIDAVGTIIDTNGTIIASQYSLNPASMIGEVNVNIGGKNQLIKPQGTTSDIKVRISDGREFPAKQIFTDSELNITFLVPDLKEGDEKPKFTPLELAKDAKSDLSDQIFVLSRCDKSLNYEPSVMVDRITSVIHKPRTMYLPSGAAGSNLGVPVFLANSEKLGFLTAIRKNAGAAAEGHNVSAQAMIVVVPMEDVMEAADQAAKEKLSEKKK